MTLLKEKNLILSLIKDDLVSTKLLEGLERLGFSVDHYCLNLSDTIFQLMKLEEKKDDDALFEYYLEIRSRVKHIEITESRDALDTMAQEIYSILIQRKE